jgi:hypothetical protein
MLIPQRPVRTPRRLSTCRGISVFLCALALAITPAAGQQEKESVVIVHTETESGYGVAWQQPDNVVTVLHLVAGKSKILVSWKNQQSSLATIKKINKEADLALLQLQKPLGVPPLEIYQGDPPLGRPLDYWEAPASRFRMDRKETRLNSERKAIPLRQFDNRIASDPKKLDAFAKALCSDGQSNYPSLNTGVFKFEERNVGKSHSGSPLTYQGKIVGVVDGGQPIGGKACVWAIPAAGNFKSLLASAAALPRRACSTEKLYGGIRKDNPLLQENENLASLAETLAASEENPFVFVDDSNDRLAFTLEYRAPFQDIYDTMFEEDQAHIQDLLEDEEDFEDGPIQLQELFSQVLDIYQDGEIGATIFVPAKSELEIEKSKDSKYTLIEASDPDFGVEMIIFVQKADSKADVEEAREWYKEYIVSDGRQWEQEKESGEDDDVEYDDLENDPDEPYYTELMDRVVYEDDTVVAELYASITIDENNILGVAIKIDNWQELTKAQRIHYYLMEACAILSDFAYY